MIGEFVLIAIGFAVMLGVIAAGLSWLRENVSLKPCDKGTCCLKEREEDNTSQTKTKV